MEKDIRDYINSKFRNVVLFKYNTYINNNKEIYEIGVGLKNLKNKVSSVSFDIDDTIKFDWLCHTINIMIDEMIKEMFYSEVEDEHIL